MIDIVDYKFKNNLTGFLFKVYENRWLKSIRHGLLIIQPFILISFILMLIINIETLYINNVMSNDFVIKLFESSKYLYTRIHSVSRAMLLLTISYSLAKCRNITLNEEINPSIVSIIGFISSLVLTKGLDSVSLSESASWVFLRIIISLTFSELFMYFYIKSTRKLTILDNRNNNLLKQSVDSIIPAFMILIIWLLLNLVLNNNTSRPILDILSAPISIYSKDDIFGSIRYLFDVQVFCFFGGHGGNIIDPRIFDKSYLNVFCNIGGAGSAICLIIAIMISNTNIHKKKIAKLSTLPCIFNINDIIVYGLPIILNPIYIIPFLLTPIVLYIVTFVMMIVGFINIDIMTINWMVPIFLNAYITTNSISGVILQLINIIIGTFIYIPFVRIYNSITEKEEYLAYNALREYIFSDDKPLESITRRSDNIGQIANILNSDLEDAVNKGEGIYLEYQPQVDKNNNVVGVESLLRWNHNFFGNIPPPIIISLAEETGLIHDLGKWIFKQSCFQLAQWNKTLQKSIYISINISSTQLKNPLFVDFIADTLSEYNLNPNNIKLEITESLALGNDLTTNTQLNELTNMGIKLVIDDFGVGYNPILYIKKYKIDSIKIDGSLIKDIDVNEDSRNIVDAMYKLCENSKLGIVDEFVETYNQKLILDSMGDGIYQGYYFSKPLSASECLEYILKSDN